METFHHAPRAQEETVVEAWTLRRWSWERGHPTALDGLCALLRARRGSYSHSHFGGRCEEASEGFLGISTWTLGHPSILSIFVTFHSLETSLEASASFSTSATSTTPA